MKALLHFLLFSMVFWNLENFFDCVDGGYSSSDAEFSARGARHWTRKRFDAKAAMVSKTFLWTGELPSVIGLAEIENERPLKALVHGDVLRKCGYDYVHYESRDPRGIDVALLYRKADMELVVSYPLPVISLREDGSRDTLNTRDILYACLQEREGGRLWHVFVNHHPSKYGGASSSGRRMSAMRTLRCSVDSLLRSGQRNIVAMGDFNDTPDSEPFALMEGAMVNMGLALGEGSIRFRGNWQLIDNFLVSADIAGKMKMEVLRPPFIMERDRQFPGEKPRRTYVGPRYNGGVSDHLPVRLIFTDPIPDIVP